MSTPFSPPAADPAHPPDLTSVFRLVVLDGRVALDPGNCALAVQKNLYLRPARDDFVTVPVARPLDARYKVGVRHHEHPVAA